MGFDVTNLHGRRTEDRWNRMAFGDLLERMTWSRPDREAIIGWEGAYASDEYARLTYRQADAVANQVAHALLETGMQRGDRVLTFCDNSVEAILLLVGIAKAGLVAAPVNPVMATDVVTWIIGHVEPRLVVVDAGLWERARPAFAAAGVTPGVVIAIGGDEVPGAVDFREWIAGAPTDEVDVTVSGDDVWELLFTSGTTAMPKASMGTHTFSYLTGYSYALSLTRGLAYEHDLRVGTFLPIVYHCGHNATLVPAWLSGGTAIVGRGPNRPEPLAAAITEEEITALWAGSPQFLEGLAEVVEVVRAWLHAENGQKVRYSGEFYSVDADVRAPVLGRLDIPVLLAAFNKRMARTATRVGDGLIGHGLFTRSWWDEVVRPAAEKGLTERADGAGTPTEHGWIITAIDDAAPERAIADARRMIAFYLTVKTYDPFVAHHGWEAPVEKLRAAFATGDTDGMAAAVTDEMLTEIAVCGTTADAVATLRRRAGSLPRDVGYFAAPSFMVGQRRRAAYGESSLALLSEV